MGTLSLDRSITLIEEAVERLQSLTGDKTEVEFDDLDLFSYRYDMADLYTRLMAQAQQTAPAGGSTPYGRLPSAVPRSISRPRRCSARAMQ